METLQQPRGGAGARSRREELASAAPDGLSGRPTVELLHKGVPVANSVLRVSPDNPMTERGEQAGFQAGSEPAPLPPVAGPAPAQAVVRVPRGERHAPALSSSR